MRTKYMVQEKMSRNLISEMWCQFRLSGIVQYVLCKLTTTDFGFKYLYLQEKRTTSHRMPEELPPINCVVSKPQGQLLHTQPMTSGAPIDTNQILTSVCDSLLSTIAASSASAQMPQQSSIDIVVVQSTPSSLSQDITVITSMTQTQCTSSVPETICSTATTPTSSVVTTPTTQQYNLSELVHQNKSVWFKHEDPNFELEPPRVDIMSVRRRSRQFFTLVEEDEVDSDMTVAETSKEDQPPQFVIDPILNLGDSLKRLYFPKEHANRRSHRRRRQPQGENQDSQENQESSTNEQPVSTSSDSGNDRRKISLFDTLSKFPELKVFNSNPCINEIPEIDDPETITYGYRKSQSLPTTPRVSPKLARKTSIIANKTTEPQGPGFSFLAGVAGELRMNKLKQGHIHEKELQKLSESKIQKVPLPSALTKDKKSVSLSQESISSVTSETSHDLESTHHVSDFSEYMGGDYKMEKSPKPVMKSLFEWGSKKKIKVTNKESNMYSPCSF
ncbi:hypothetical protein ACF0H5_008879 [Mactra antiquata]